MMEALLRAELEKVRAAKKPTRRGILVCGTMMAEMIRFGWREEQLDALEIVFWQLRDADGRLVGNTNKSVPQIPNDKPEANVTSVPAASESGGGAASGGKEGEQSL